MRGNTYIALNTETWNSKIPVELEARYGWQECETVETGETCSRTIRVYEKDEEGSYVYEEVKHIDEETGEEYTTMERVYKEVTEDYPCTEDVCKDILPTWDELANSSKHKSLYGAPVKLKVGNRNIYVVELTASWLAHEMSAVMALGNGLEAPQNTLMTADEAQYLISNNTPNE